MTSPYSHLIKLYQLLAIQNFAVEKEKLEKSLLSKKVTMTKFTPGICCICRSSADLRNIHHKYIYEDDIEDYIEMFFTCFNIEMVDKEKQGEICEPCVMRLKDGVLFRKQVEAVVQAQEDSINTLIATSNEASNDWLNTVGNEIWRKKCGNRTIFCTHSIPKPPVTNVKPTLPRDATTCPICSMEFDTHFNLVRHHSSHYQNYICKTCGKGYHSNSNYKRHLSLHENRRLPCQMCSKVYSNRDGLNQHIQIHHKKIKLYRCRKCPERFSASSTRQKHMFEKHGVDCRRFACAECGKIFFTIQHHNSHVKRTHLNMREHSCTQCDSSFHTARELKSHGVKHTTVRKFACNQCDKMFKMQKTLKSHMLLHSSQRQFPCDCGAAFSQQAALTAHMKTHSSDWQLLDPSPPEEYAGQLFYITPYSTS